MVAFNNSGASPTSTTTRYDGACLERSRENGQRVLLETDATGTEFDLRCFVYGNTIDEVLLMVDLAGGNGVPDGDYYYGHDHLYSVHALFDAGGHLSSIYYYADSTHKCNGAAEMTVSCYLVLIAVLVSFTKGNKLPAGSRRTKKSPACRNRAFILTGTTYFLGVFTLRFRR